MSSAPSGDCYVCCTHTHTHTMQFLFGLFLSTALRLHINISGYVYSVKELKESEDFQKCILRWCSVKCMGFVLLVKKIILDKDFFFRLMNKVERVKKNAKFISFWPLSIWTLDHLSIPSSHTAVHISLIFIFFQSMDVTSLQHFLTWTDFRGRGYLL